MTDAQFAEFRQLIAKEQFNQALERAQGILETDSENADALGARAVAKFHLKDTSCLIDLNQAIALEPENAYRYSSRAYVLDALGDTEAAVIDYLKAVELDPEDYVAFNNLGMLEEKLGRQKKAQSHFDESDALLGLKKKEGRYQFPDPPLQQSLNQAKSKSMLQVFKETFTSKEGWQSFYQFLSQKFKRN